MSMGLQGRTMDKDDTLQGAALAAERHAD